MGIEFLLPMLISAGISAISGGISAWQRSRANRQQAQAAQEHAGSLQEMIDRMFATDTTRPIIDAASRQIGGGFAGAGLAGSGMSQAAAAEAAASIMAQDLARKQGIEAQVRQDPSFRAPDPSEFRPWLDGLLGLLAGGAAGGGEAFGQFLGTETGAGWLAGQGAASPATSAAVATTPIPTNQFAVPASAANFGNFSVAYRPEFMDRPTSRFGVRY